jgi:UDP-glucose 4-epimerase
MKSQKILVTGGAGYIGAHAALALHEAGYEPVLLDDFSKSDDSLLKGLKKITGKSFSFHKGDCCDKFFLRSVLNSEGDIGAVMHFAAYKSVGESVEKPLMYYRNNLGSVVALAEVMQEAGIVRLVLSSSCTVYGQPDVIPVTEAAPFKKAESPYGATKQMSELILQDWCRSWPQARVVSLRYFNPIGADPSGLIGELPIDVPSNLVPYITQTAAGIREKLVVFGGDYNTPDGTCLRDFIHVADLAEAHVRALGYLESHPVSFEAINLGTGSGTSVLQLIRTFEDSTGVKLPYKIGPRRPGDVEKTYADTRLAASKLGWTCRYSLAEALKHAWQWEKNLRGIR